MGMSVGGVMVSIDAFQALDPGSIPGHRSLFYRYHKNCYGYRNVKNAQYFILVILYDSYIMIRKDYLVDRFQFDEFEIELEFVVGEMVISQTVRPLDDFLV